jgi:predicted MPP superfamily phosphohydrolase
MILYVSGFLFLYLLIRLILPLPLGGKGKCAAALLLALVSQQHHLCRLFFGNMVSPELPQPLLIFSGWLFISLLFFFLLLLLHDIVLIVLRLLRLAGPRLSLPWSHNRRMALLLSAALVLAGFGVGQALRVPDVRNVEITVNRLPEELDGLVLAHLADIHASALLPGQRVRAIVDRVNALRPDLILVSGDIVDGTPRRRAKDVAPLADLAARLGVFVCVGNHEYYVDFPGWMEAFARMGVTVLENRHVVLAVNGRELVLAGVTDIVAGRYGLQLPDVDAALDGAPADAFRILLAHRPGTAETHARAGVDLQLSGHTHGGHIAGFDRIVARYNGGFVSGLYAVERMLLYVNNGAGLWSGFPVRLGVPSEIARIVLRAAPRSDPDSREGKL